MFQYKTYHYEMEQFNDVGFGCSYRNIQTILSCKQYDEKSSMDVPHITKILSFFNPHYQEDIEKQNKRSLWIEPSQIYYYLLHHYNINGELIVYILKKEHTKRMIKTSLYEYDIYTKYDFNLILQKMKNHFNDSNLPIVIDDGYYSYCIGDIKDEYVFIIDPHQRKDVSVYTKSISELKTSFWMIYIPGV